MRNLLILAIFSLVFFLFPASVQADYVYSDWIFPTHHNNFPTCANFTAIDGNTCTAQANGPRVGNLVSALDSALFVDVRGIQVEMHARRAGATFDTSPVRFCHGSNCNTALVDFNNSPTQSMNHTTLQDYTFESTFNTPQTLTPTTFLGIYFQADSFNGLTIDYMRYRFIYDAPEPPPIPEPEDLNTCTAWTDFNSYSTVGNFQNASSVFSLDSNTYHIERAYYSLFQPSDRAIINYVSSGTDPYDTDYQINLADPAIDYIKYRIFPSTDSTTTKFSPISKVGQFGKGFDLTNLKLGEYNYFIHNISIPNWSTNYLYKGLELRVANPTSSVPIPDFQIDHVQFALCSEDVEEAPFIPTDQSQSAIPSFSVLNTRINEVLGYARIDVEGDTDFTEQGAVCRVILHHEYFFPSSQVQRTSNISTIELIADDARTESVELAEIIGASVYLGGGFSPTSSTFFANDVLVPFEAGATNNYKATYQCSDSDGEEVYNFSDNSNINIASPSGTLDVIEDCSEWDLLCKFSNWFKSWFWATFSFQASNVGTQISTLRNTIESKAPFAYVYAFYDLNFGDADEFSSDTPVRVIPLETTVFDTNIDLSFPEWADPAITYFRPIFSLFLWVTFIFYLAHIGQRTVS